MPDKFDEFNEALGVKWMNDYEKQEAFADVAAFAILGSGDLKKHLPHPFSDSMLDVFNRYVSYITGSVLKQST